MKVLNEGFWKLKWRVNSRGLTFLGAIVILFSIFYHELSHAIVAGFFGMQIDQVGLVFLGAYVAINDVPLQVQNSWPSVLVSLAGPVGNLACGVICAKIFHKVSESNMKLKILVWFGAVLGIRLALCNILPLGFLDGGKLAFKILYISGGKEIANIFMPMLSFITLYMFISYGLPGRKIIEKHLGI